MTDKKPGIMLPTASDEAPVRNFLILLLLIPVAPFLMIYSIVTGRLQNPFIVGACLTMMLAFGTYYTYDRYFSEKPSRKEKILALVEEVNPKEKLELKQKISTIRKSIGTKNLPKELYPMLDIQQDMLTINYYYFLMEAGYMGKRAEGAVYVLQNALYSPSLPLAKAAWESLHLINTPEAITAREIFVNDSKKIKEASTKEIIETQQEKEFKKKYVEPKRTWADDTKDKFINWKNGW